MNSNSPLLDNFRLYRFYTIWNCLMAVNLNSPLLNLTGPISNTFKGLTLCSNSAIGSTVKSFTEDTG